MGGPHAGEKVRRTGRGRRSSIDMLPPSCEEDILWVKAELDARQTPQTDILDAFNVRLAEKGEGPISKGAFSRYSVNAATLRREMEMERELNQLAYELLPDIGESDPLVVARETLKLRLSALSADRNADPKAVSTLTLAIGRLNRTLLDDKAEARRQAEEDRKASDRKREADKLAEIEEQRKVSAMAESVATIAQEAGPSGDRIAAIRRGVPGPAAAPYTHLRAHETKAKLVCRLLLETNNTTCWPFTTASSRYAP